MEKMLQICLLVAFGMLQGAADSKKIDLRRIEWEVYVFHNPEKKASLEHLPTIYAGKDGRLAPYAEFRMRRDSFSSPELALKDNQIYVNGKPWSHPISIIVKASISEDSNSAIEASRYAPAQRCVALWPDRVAMFPLKDSSSSEAQDNPLKYALSVLKVKGEKDPAIIIDLCAWLNFRYTREELAMLPDHLASN